MKITQEQLKNLILEEFEKIDQQTLEEGVFDYLKGAGQSAGSKAGDLGKAVAKQVNDKATAVKNKVGQVTGDIRTAGATASLKGDLQRAIQQSGMMVEKFKNQFTDLLARAQSLRLDDEEGQIKSELQALQTYQETASKSIHPETATVSKPELGTTQAPKQSPADVSLPAMNSDKPLSQSDRRAGGPTAKPSAIDFGDQGGGMDWKANQTTKSAPKQTSITPQNKKTAPKVQTKLSPETIRATVKKYGPDQAAKKLGVSKQALINALK